MTNSKGIGSSYFDFSNYMKPCIRGLWISDRELQESKEFDILELDIYDFKKKVITEWIKTEGKEDFKFFFEY